MWRGNSPNRTADRNYPSGVVSTASSATRPDDQSFAALRSMLVKYRGRMVVANGLRAASSVLPALHPYFVAEMATSADDTGRAGRFLALLFLTGLAHFVLWTGADFYVSAKIQPLTYEFKRIAFDTVWSEDYQSFVNRPSGKVASYVNDLRNHIQVLWDSAHFGFLPVLSSIPVYVVLLWRTSSGNAVVYAVFMVLAGAVMTKIAGPVHDRQRRLTNNTSDNTGRVFDSYSNFVNVFSFRAQPKEIARNDDQLDGLIDDDVKFSYALSAYWGVSSLLVRGLLWAVVIGFSWWQFDRGTITFPAMVVSVTVLLDFTNQYWNVIHNLGEWIDKSARFREAYTYLFPGRNIVAEPLRSVDSSTASSIASSPVDASDVSEPNGSAHGPGAAVRTERSAEGSDPGPAGISEGIEVRGLRFAYPDEPDRLVLNDISFTVAKGERLGVVGRSGEGKSTLIKILLGFYEPTGGVVLIDGSPTGPGELAKLHSYVPQDTSLFQETIEYNIGYAEPGPAHPDRIRRAAEKANIADFIDTLPDGFQTLVGERGIKLSLGQRQRIAIARAFLRQADLVILDEATSALDSETEAKIQQALLELWDGRAAIVIAHRLATLNDVDRILVIEEGRIVEQGPKEELLSTPGRFAEMWGLQRSGLS